MRDDRTESRRRLCLVVDVERYSGRSYAAQTKVQDGVAHALDFACQQAGVRWRDCERQDRGDGQLLLLPPGIDEEVAVPGLVLGLRDMLPPLNARVPEEHLIRLRVALAQGAVRSAKLGFVAWSVELASRLLDSATLRKELAAAPGSDMALIVPDDLYKDRFERGSGGLPASVLRKVRVKIKAKGFAADAWVGALPRGRTAPLGFPSLPPEGPLERPRRPVAQRAGEAAAVLLGGTLLVLPDTSQPQHQQPEGDDAGPTDAPSHSADRPVAARAADRAEAVASTADQVVGSPYAEDALLTGRPSAAHDWGEHYAQSVAAPVAGPAHETYDDEPVVHDTAYDHDAYDHDPYDVLGDADEILAQDDVTDPHVLDDLGPGSPADPHHPGW